MAHIRSAPRALTRRASTDKSRTHVPSLAFERLLLFEPAHCDGNGRLKVRKADRLHEISQHMIGFGPGHKRRIVTSRDENDRRRPLPAYLAARFNAVQLGHFDVG